MKYPAKYDAFTLIELLVVVTIIVVLLALLAPALDRAIAAAEAVVCANNQRNMHQAFVWYQNDYHNSWIAPWDANNLAGVENGPLPPPEQINMVSNAANNLGSWQWQWPYVMAFYAVPGHGQPTVPPAKGTGSTAGRTAGTGGSASFMNPRAGAMMFCPTLLGQQRTWFAGSGWTTWSYAMMAPPYTKFGYPKVTRFTHPSDSVHLQDFAWFPTVDVSGNTTGKAETVPNAWSNYNSVATDPHMGRSNYVFCDGHVERLAQRWTEGDNGTLQTTPAIDRKHSDLRKDAFTAY